MTDSETWASYDRSVGVAMRLQKLRDALADDPENETLRAQVAAMDIELDQAVAVAARVGETTQ